MTKYSAKAKTAEPVIPKASVPKKVLDSNEKPSTVKPPNEKKVIGEKAEEKKVAPSSSELLDKKERVYPDAKPKGTITLYIYENKPYEAKFTGHIAGFEMNIAVPAIRKQYKLWKRSLIKTGGK